MLNLFKNELIKIYKSRELFKQFIFITIPVLIFLLMEIYLNKTSNKPYVAEQNFLTIQQSIFTMYGTIFIPLIVSMFFAATFSITIVLIITMIAEFSILIYFFGINNISIGYYNIDYKIALLKSLIIWLINISYLNLIPKVEETAVEIELLKRAKSEIKNNSDKRYLTILKMDGFYYLKTHRDKEAIETFTELYKIDNKNTDSILVLAERLAYKKDKKTLDNILISSNISAKSFEGKLLYLFQKELESKDDAQLIKDFEALLSNQKYAYLIIYHLESVFKEKMKNKNNYDIFPYEYNESKNFSPEKFLLKYSELIEFN